jgi:guanidinoacetate N-methyltransferase
MHFICGDLRHLVTGLWQDQIDRLGKFDAILFDTFPLTKEEEGKSLIAPFIPVAREHLKPGGIFTCYSGAAETLPAESLKLLLGTFDEVRLYKLGGLQPPKGSPFWSAGSMVVPVCTVR